MSAMTTYYDQIPTLGMRVRAAELVIVGKVGTITRTDTETYGNITYVRTTFNVEIVERLKGETRRETLEVEVPGGSAESAETPMELPIREGQTLIFMLSDAGREDVWVPYLRSAFVIEGESVKLGKHAAEIAGTEARGQDISLSDLRKVLAEAAMNEADKATPDLSEISPVTELPSEALNGGQFSRPEPGPVGD